MTDQTAIQGLNDRDLFRRLYQIEHSLWASDQDPTPMTPAVEQEYNDLQLEIDRRFGDGAVETLGDWFTATKASAHDMLMWAEHSANRLVEIARGHDCDNDSLQPYSAQLQGHTGDSARCWCGRIWRPTASGSGWYDPTEGTDPTAPHEAGTASHTRVEGAPKLQAAITPQEPCETCGHFHPAGSAHPQTPCGSAECYHAWTRKVNSERNRTA